jgi:uncharacterized protein involved in exopolysaccharide biosynthesis
VAETELLPLEAIPWRGVAALFGRALRRHWLAIAAVTMLFTAVGVAAAKYLPRTYVGESRLLVRKGTSTMAAITDPRRAIVPGFDNPAQAAVELALSRQALESIVRDADLVAHFKANRPPLLALVDRLRVAVSGPMNPDDEFDAVVGLVQGRLRVSLAEEVVRMRIEWTDAEGVERILTQAVQAFMTERQRLDIESIETSHSILQTAVAAMRVQVGEQVVAFQRARASVLGANAATIRSRPVTSLSVGQLRDRLLERRAYREELERQRRQRTAALEVQLSQQAETMGPSHPDRIATERALAGLMTEDESLRRARNEESASFDAFVAAGGSLDVFGESAVDESPLDPAAARPDDDPTVIAARAELRIRVDGYQDLTMRLENARLELETARAAMPFRYMLTHPPERPRKPVAPAVPIIVMGALFAGLFSGFLLALAMRIRAESRAAGQSIIARLQSLDVAVVPS